MGANLAQLLLQATAVSTAALMLVALLRRPLRRVAGARAAYWLWLALPATALAVLLPAPAYTPPLLANSLLPELTGQVSSALASGASASATNYISVGLALWVTGAVSMAAWLIHRQHSFVRSLGPMTAGADGLFRSARTSAPMLVGAWRTRVIVPADFETRFPEKHRELMLAHERAHQQRGDALVNTFSAAWLCLFWFNPLMYWAAGRMRLDQELACDALVVSRSEASRKNYAEALLKAQLTSQSAWRVPAGCHWQSTHPLKERIIMLKSGSPNSRRRLAGIGFALAFTISAVYLASSSLASANPQASSAASASPKFTIDARNTEVREVIQQIASKGGRNILVSDQVAGKITVQLKDVTWQQALDIVAQSQGLTVRQSENVTLVDVSK